MTALDTNVLVRIVTGDDPEQLPAAVAVMRAGRLWVSKTVLLELEWALRHAYDLDRQVINDALGKLLGLPNLETEDRRAVIQARSWHRQGMDFADALHLASSPDAESFATFDRVLATTARKLKTPIVDASVNQPLLSTLSRPDVAGSDAPGNRACRRAPRTETRPRPRVRASDHRPRRRPAMPAGRRRWDRRC